MHHKFLHSPANSDGDSSNRPGRSGQRTRSFGRFVARMRGSCAPAGQSYRSAMVRNHAVASVRRRRSQHTTRMSIERGLFALEGSQVVRFLCETDLRGWRCLRRSQQQGRFHRRGNAFDSGDWLVRREAQNRVTGRANDKNRHHKQPKHRPHVRKMDPGLLFGKLAPRRTMLDPARAYSVVASGPKHSRCAQSAFGASESSGSSSGGTAPSRSASGSSSSSA